MIKIFLPSGPRGECERCGQWFDPVHGGVCASCGRILCGTDLYGSMISRLRGYIGLTVRCRVCRQGLQADEPHEQ